MQCAAYPAQLAAKQERMARTVGALCDELRPIVPSPATLHYRNKAKLVVSTNKGATINGEYYGYGEADVEMVGEGSTWKLSRFSPSIMVFKDPPKAP